MLIKVSSNNRIDDDSDENDTDDDDDVEYILAKVRQMIVPACGMGGWENSLWMNAIITIAIVFFFFIITIIINSIILNTIMKYQSRTFQRKLVQYRSRPIERVVLNPKFHQQPTASTSFLFDCIL